MKSGKYEVRSTKLEVRIRINSHLYLRPDSYRERENILKSLNLTLKRSALFRHVQCQFRISNFPLQTSMSTSYF